MEDSQHKHGSLTHTRDGLAEDVVTEDGVGDAALLDLTGMLETAIGDSSQQLLLENHVLEGGRVDASDGSGSCLGTILLMAFLLVVL